MKKVKKENILKYIKNNKLSIYKEYSWWCYILAKHLQEVFWWELYSNIDHVILKVLWIYFDNTGVVNISKYRIKFIPIDPEEEKRYIKNFTNVKK